MKMNCNHETGKLQRFPYIHQLVAALALAAGLFVTGCATTHHAPPPTSKVQQSNITPTRALGKCEAGNARFVAGHPLHRNRVAQREQTASGQYPIEMVLCCVDICQPLTLCT